MARGAGNRCAVRRRPQGRLYYRYDLGTVVGDKYMCVVVKASPDDAFVLTAFLTDRNKKGRRLMAAKRVKVWYDREGDYLEVMFEQRPGYFRETGSDAVMEKVDEEGNILGFSILRVSALGAQPLDVAL